MAQEVRVVLLCDKCEDRKEATTTLAYALNGESYEADLCEKHKAEAEKAIKPWTEIGRRSGRPSSRTDGALRTRRKPVQHAVPYDPETVRQWAKLSGLNVAAEGRLSPSTIKKWRDAGSPTGK